MPFAYSVSRYLVPAAAVALVLSLLTLCEAKAATNPGASVTDWSASIR
jgi:hypothetical protein